MSYLNNGKHLISEPRVSEDASDTVSKSDRSNSTNTSQGVRVPRRQSTASIRPVSVASSIFSVIPFSCQDRYSKIVSAIELRDVQALRELAISDGGLLNTNLRRKAWPLLLNVDSFYMYKHHDTPHRDEHQVDIDLTRTNLPRMAGCVLSSELRKRVQKQLGNVVKTILRAHPWLSYYQGFHELAMVFLIILNGGNDSLRATESAALFFVRDAMGDNLETIRTQLSLIYTLLENEDPELHTLLDQLAIPPFFAISWVLSWFAHDLVDLNDMARLYDFFMSSSPLAPIYVAASLVSHNRSKILGSEPEFAVVHALLVGLPQGNNDWAEILARSSEWMEEYPLARLQELGNVKLNKK
ncbi:GTPase-activating protein gyp8 [Mycoemilia scoparia]|uniref:GTPase-activating protein gyp8 n=1 Tax=Mycoemilia scoparia TaxID=417184 RepID=A0A9W8DV65_9FUNG|nr:GTPase-activating protein gyp8 [Mycoemilia scoparia]